MRVLLNSGDDAIQAALGEVEGVMDKAEKFSRTETFPVTDDREKMFDDLRAVAWVLPSLRAVCRDCSDGDRLDGYQRRMREHAEQLSTQSGPRGFDR